MFPSKSFLLLFLIFLFHFNFVQSNKVAKRQATKLCRFIAPSNNGTIMTYEVRYISAKMVCLNCPRVTTLVRKHSSKDDVTMRRSICDKVKCNGMLCPKKRCIKARDITSTNQCGLDGRATGGGGEGVGGGEEEPPSANQVPIIIGFAIGGIMLAVVIGGIFIGRSRGNANDQSSEVMTTPVSMSYSEWISSHSMGGRGSKGSNMRIQESQEEGTVPVYNIVYNESNLSGSDTRDSQANPVVIEVDDDIMNTLSFEQNPETVSENQTPNFNEEDFEAEHFTFSYKETENSDERMSTTSSRSHDMQTTEAEPTHCSEWSDESDCGTSLIASSNRNHINTEQDKNLSTIKHVFADVHRSNTDITTTSMMSLEETEYSQLSTPPQPNAKKSRLDSSASGEYAIPYGAIHNSNFC